MQIELKVHVIGKAYKERNNIGYEISAELHERTK